MIIMTLIITADTRATNKKQENKIIVAVLTAGGIKKKVVRDYLIHTTFLIF